MKINKVLIALIFGLGLTLGLVWLLGGGLPVRAATINDVNTTEDELNSDGDCSLREAIQAANTDTAVDGCTAGSGDDTITLPAGTYTLTILGRNEDANLTGDLDITDTLTIVGAGPDQTIINANGIDRVLDIQYGVSTVVISGVTIFNGYVWASGGGIDNWGADLTLINTVVLSNTANVYVLTPGGGIAHSDGVLTLINTSVLSNAAAGRGGGVYVYGGSVVLSDTLISGNTVTGKYTDRDGGGLYVYHDSHVTLHGGQIVSNTAEYDGGGVHIRDNTTFTQTGDTLIAYNIAATSDGCGGGVYVTSSSVILGEAQILSNTARMGGGVCVNVGSVTLSGTRVISNHANVSGGGVWVVDVGRATLRGAHVLSNTASSGGGIGNAGEVSIENTILAGNRTSGDGDGIYNHNASAITITNSTLSGNYATDPGSDGGALTNNGGTAVLIYTTIVSNTADRCGGGICVFNNGVVWLQNTILAHNLNRGVISNCYTSLTLGGYITSTGHNLEDTDTCGLTATGDLTDTNPLIGPLTDDGGVLVHPLLPGSPAVDAGACIAGITTDQRGITRPQGGGCDIGAYETLPVITLPAITLTKSGPTWFNLGTYITYTIHVTNTGTLTATSVVLTDTLPAGSNFVWAGNGGIEASGVVTWPTFSIPPAGGVVTRTFTVTATTTITNDDYRVSCAEGVSAAGSVSVVTDVIGKCKVYLPLVMRNF